MLEGSKARTVAATLALLAGCCAAFAWLSSKSLVGDAALRARREFSPAAVALSDRIVALPVAERRRLEPLIAAGEVEFLFVSDGGEIWLRTGRVGVLREKLGIEPRVAVPDLFGALQSLSGDVGSAAKPALETASPVGMPLAFNESEASLGWSAPLELALQWHRFAWPTPLLDRFPLTLDQRLQAVRLGHPDERRYWSAPGDKAASARMCPKHFPATMRLLEAIPNFPRGTRPVTVWLHDALPDFSHPRLAPLHKAQPGSGVPQLADAHGSAMASALEDGLVGGAGKESSLVALQPIPLPLEGGRVRLSEVLKGLGKIADSLDSASGTAVVLLGYGFDLPDSAHVPGQPLRDAIDRLLARKVVLFAPAGNSMDSSAQALPPLAPARYASLSVAAKERPGRLFGIAASDLCSRRAWFSREAQTPEGMAFYAPGERIYAALPGNDYGFLSGSSFSAAQVAGLAARALTVREFTPAELGKFIERSARGLPAVHDHAFLVDAVRMGRSLGPARAAVGGEGE